jgi:hypothetical protein
MSISSFKEFITEQEELVIDTNAELVVPNLDKVNEDLDAVTEAPFVNSAVFMNAVRGTLERYGVILPASYVMPMLSAEAETVYSLGDSGLYLYICHDLHDGLVEGYAQIVTEEDLDDLMSMEDDEDVDSEEETKDSAARTHFELPAKRRSNDDSGNDSEYA